MAAEADMLARVGRGGIPKSGLKVGKRSKGDGPKSPVRGEGYVENGRTRGGVARKEGRKGGTGPFCL